MKTSLLLLGLLLIRTSMIMAQTGHFRPAFEGNEMGHMNVNLVRPPASLVEPEGEGFSEGNPEITKLWNNTSGNEQILEPDTFKGSSAFLKHESVP